jgi:sugar phosphate isomerase/epimerase
MSHRSEASLPALIFWPQGVIQRPFDEQLRIAKAGDFDGIAIAPATYRRLLADGMTAQDVVQKAADHGLACSQIDGVANWLPDWAPTQGEAKVNERLRAQYDVPLDFIFDMAGAIGAKSMCVAGFFDEGSVPLDEVVEHFARLCDRAAPLGLSVDLEFIPIWGIRDLPLAWEIVKRADRQNSSVLVDTWHLQIGSSDLDRDLALLDEMPAPRLTNVQIVDAPLPRRATTIAREAWHRTFPGRGDLALDRILPILLAKGGLRYAGPELFGAEIVDMDADEMGRLSGETTREVLRNAAQAPSVPETQQ